MIHRRNEVMIWEPSAWGGITHTKFDPDMLWTPDIYLIEDVSDEMSGQDKYKTPITCQHTGMQVPVMLLLTYSLREGAIFPPPSDILPDYSKLAPVEGPGFWDFYYN